MTDVLRGLRAPHKELPCKYFYDARGSALFDEICELEEYYPTRTELLILRAHAGEMVALLGRGCSIIEYGSGSSIKTRLLLDQVHAGFLPAAYVPVDISREHLLATAAALSQRYPGLTVLPVPADFSAPFVLPPLPRECSRRVVYFPGSTIGNFPPDAARRLLRRMATTCGAGGGLLLGVDLKKDVAVLEQAYNDARGVTAEFNLNLLARINRELDADFELSRFAHKALYNQAHGRIEMHLISQADQLVHVDDVTIPFREGEGIHTESSYKYTEAEVRDLAAAAGFGAGPLWTDPDRLFGVFYLPVA